MNRFIYVGVPFRAAISVLWFALFFPIAVVIFTVFVPADIGDLMAANRQVCQWVVDPRRVTETTHLWG